MITVVILGRPNVGKSTLFNKLAKTQRAITHNYAGTTRDYKSADAVLGDIEFKIVDTAGLCFGKNLSSFEVEINNQTEVAVSKADLILFVVDGKQGIVIDDKNIADFLRKKDLKAPIILVVNKCDHKSIEQNFHDFFELGYSEMCQISAEHTIGMKNLYDYIKSGQQIAPLEEPVSKIKVAMIGRPNVGKSTLINALTHENRLITSPEPGTTRDAISIELTHKGTIIELTDTAGLRKKRNVERYGLEQLSVKKTVEAIDASDIIVLIVDVNTLLESQDLKIASLAVDRSKPVILVVNKTDTIKTKDQLEHIQDEIKYLSQLKLTSIKTLYVVYVSALNKKNVTQILDKIVSVYALWSKRIPTAQLNEWLSSAVEAHQPPLTKAGRRIKLKYITQVKAQPPIFKMFVNNSAEIPPHYLQYLIGKLETDFGFNGVPIKILKAQSANPYSVN